MRSKIISLLVLSMIAFSLVIVPESAYAVKPPVSKQKETSKPTPKPRTQSIVSFPSTYSISVGDGVEYFIFKSRSEVIWCFESVDHYLFAVAYGSYNMADQTLTFSKKKIYSSANMLRDGDVKFKLSMSGGSLCISTNNRRGVVYLGADVNEKVKLTRCGNITPSSRLAGTSWEFSSDEMRYKVYFKSSSEVVIDGEPHCYVLIGDHIGILVGDNPDKEAWVGFIDGDKIYLHRSGFRRVYDYHMTLYRVR